MSSKGFLLFNIKITTDAFTGRPTETQIINWTIGTAYGFSNLGTQAQAAAGITFTAVTNKIKIPTAKYRLQRNALARDIHGEWKLWTVIKPEDVVPRNPNLVNLVLQEQPGEDLLSLAIEFYNTNKVRAE